MLNAADAEGLENFLSRQADAMGGAILSFGTVIDGWRVAGLLGRGGSGEVYRVVRGSETAALKILAREGDAAKLRFAAEVEFLADNKLTQFPRFISAGEFEGRPYVIMELLEPVELPTGEAGIADYLLSVCACVRSLHRAGIVHRDIKPRNIMRRSTGEIVLIDFGLVKNPSGDPLPRTDISVVAGRAVGVGTPGYAAPEQFTGGDITPASDIHALGVLAEKLLERGSGLLSASSWRKIIRSATSSIASERYQSVDEFAAAIRHRHWLRRSIVVGVSCFCLLGLVFAVLLIPRMLMDPFTSLFHCEGIENGRTVYRIDLNAIPESIVLKKPVTLKGPALYRMNGPGGLTANLSGIGDVTIELRRATLYNNTEIPLKDSSIKYCLKGNSDLRFPHLTQEDSVDKISYEPGFNSVEFGQSPTGM